MKDADKTPPAEEGVDVYRGQTPPSAEPSNGNKWRKRSQQLFIAAGITFAIGLVTFNPFIVAGALCTGYAGLLCEDEAKAQDEAGTSHLDPAAQAQKRMGLGMKAAGFGIAMMGLLSIFVIPPPAGLLVGLAMILGGVVANAIGGNLNQSAKYTQPTHQAADLNLPARQPERELEQAQSKQRTASVTETTLTQTPSAVPAQATTLAPAASAPAASVVEPAAMVRARPLSASPTEVVPTQVQTDTSNRLSQPSPRDSKTLKEKVSEAVGTLKVNRKQSLGESQQAEDTQTITAAARAKEAKDAKLKDMLNELDALAENTEKKSSVSIPDAEARTRAIREKIMARVKEPVQQGQLEKELINSPLYQKQKQVLAEEGSLKAPQTQEAEQVASKGKKAAEKGANNQGELFENKIFKEARQRLVEAQNEPLAEQPSRKDMPKNNGKDPKARQ